VQALTEELSQLRDEAKRQASQKQALSEELSQLRHELSAAKRQAGQKQIETLDLIAELKQLRAELDEAKMQAEKSFTEAPADVPASHSTTSIDHQSDSSHCCVCDTKLGKRHLKPRHACQYCGKAVCGPCSPNNIKLKGQMVRVCNSCVEMNFSASPVRDMKRAATFAH
jgi:hypothetical protein